jgi:hypothetical protein
MHSELLQDYLWLALFISHVSGMLIFLGCHPGLIRHLRKDEGADSFVPILIYVVLRANPEHLLSNVEYV